MGLHVVSRHSLSRIDLTFWISGTTRKAWGNKKKDNNPYESPDTLNRENE
jgi:hypothetical protein